jgi:transcriptional regulator with XRE-family HTH domain
MNNFGKYLKKLRKKNNFTLRQVEEKIHISNSYLSQLEQGKRNIPTLKIIIKLAKVYKISINKLIKKAI